MNRIRPIASAICALLSLGFIAHESIHFYRYQHFAPLGLHLEVIVSTSNEILGEQGTGKIYQARLTNYGIIPTRFIGCDFIDWASRRQTMLNYIVERRQPKNVRWEYVPELDEYGSRIFCRDSFEVTDTRRAPHWFWPGQTMQFGEIIPAQMGGFRIGDDARYTVFLAADGNGLNSLSTHSFRVDQEPLKRPVRSPQP